jgi:SPP1 gp7 family putative phage head morphogenesis protein
VKKYDKEVAQAQLNNEKAVLKRLEENYQDALDEINDRIAMLLGRADADMQHVIYQVEYQKALKKQIEAITEKLHSDEYSTIEQYLKECYTDAYVGTMYDISGQGIPVITPIDQTAVVRAVMTDSKISEGLYTALGVDTKALKIAISAEISRGIATGQSYAQIAKNLNGVANTKYSNAMRIVRTEGHRIQNASTFDAQQAAKAKGCNVVKQWDSTLDGKTRPTHRELDGQIREVEEYFEAAGKKAKYPGDFGDPAEDCNCRCTTLTRAKWALGEEELKTLQDRARFFGLDKTESFEDYKKKYLKAAKDST